MPVPPITIGELTNVPTFDSAIASPWAQDVTRMLVHRFANTADRDAFGSWPTGRMAFTTDTETLWLKESGGWVIVSEPLQVNVTNNVWRNGVTAWDQAKTPNSPIGTASARYQRAMGLCHVYTDMTLGANPGPITPELILPFAPFDNLEGKLPVAIYQPGSRYFPGWSTVVGTGRFSIQALHVDTVSGGGNCIVQVALNTLTPFNWGASGGTISVSGWYQMASRYS